MMQGCTRVGARVPGAGRLGILLLCLAGCGHAAEPYTDYSKEFPVRPVSNDGNGFYDFVRAAQSAESKASPDLKARTVFTPFFRKKVDDATADGVKMIRSAIEKKFDFDYKPVGPFQASPYQDGWRLIGRSMVWGQQEAFATGDTAKGLKLFLDTIRFGFALTQGAATDASLGITIVNESRMAILPHMHDFDAAQLRTLAQGIQTGLVYKGTLEAALDHESQNLMSSIDTIQDLYRRKELDQLKKNLGPDVRDAVTYLSTLQDDDRRVKYFDGFAAEARDEIQHWHNTVRLPAVKRLEVKQAPLASLRPWKRFSAVLFPAFEYLMPMNDRCLARTRMLAIYALILAEIKENGKAPDSIGAFPAAVRQDPYTGLPFFYHADGRDYRLYSAGSDFKDDGGQTDETGISPDLTLEHVEAK